MASKRESHNVSAGHVVAACRLRWGESSAVFEQVGNGTGYRSKRHADVVAMGLWPSRGLWLEGIEIKVSRADWLSELKQPDKADPIAKFCDFWWLAVGDDSIVKEGELPERWGLLVLKGGKLHCQKQAPKLDPEPLDRGFVAAILRRAADAQASVKSSAEQAGYRRGIEAAPQVQAHERTNAENDLEELRRSLAEFEAKSGLKIESYGGGYLGELVGKLRELRGWRQHRYDPSDKLESAARELEARASDIRHEAKMLRKDMRAMAGLEPIAEPTEVANG